MAGSDQHIKPLRLFDLSRQKGTHPTEEERQHLRQCDECERIIEVFARQFTRVERGPNDKLRDAAQAASGIPLPSRGVAVLRQWASFSAVRNQPTESGIPSTLFFNSVQALVSIPCRFTMFAIVVRSQDVAEISQGTRIHR